MAVCAAWSVIAEIHTVTQLLYFTLYFNISSPHIPVLGQNRESFTLIVSHYTLEGVVLSLLAFVSLLYFTPFV